MLDKLKAKLLEQHTLVDAKPLNSDRTNQVVPHREEEEKKYTPGLANPNYASDRRRGIQNVNFEMLR